MQGSNQEEMVKQGGLNRQVVSEYFQLAHEQPIRSSERVVRANSSVLGSPAVAVPAKHSEGDHFTWIKEQQEKLRAQEREPRESLDHQGMAIKMWCETITR
jgi:hypothetical protein